MFSCFAFAFVLQHVCAWLLKIKIKIYHLLSSSIRLTADSWQAQTNYKPDKYLQLCAKHQRKLVQFLQQAQKAGKREELINLEKSSPGDYLDLFTTFCNSTMMGRPAADSKRFDWSLVKTEVSGTRESQELVSVFLCEEDYINYYVNKAPSYERVSGRIKHQT